MDKNQLEKKKGAVGHGLKAWTCLFKMQTKRKTMKKPTDYKSNITNFCNDNTLTGYSDTSQYRIYAQCVYDLLTLLFNSTI